MARAIALVSDIFFSAKIMETAKQCGCPVLLAAEEGTFLKLLEKEKPSAVFVDLGLKEADVLQLPRKIRQLSPHTEAIGFLTHVQSDLKRQAEQAGYKVYTRSRFFEELPEILRKA